LTQKNNEETPDFGAATPFAFFLRDEVGNMIAGCNGGVIFGCIDTEQFWVAQNNRNAGLGRNLMNEIHEYGKKIGCSMATVNTMSFQCPRVFMKN